MKFHTWNCLLFIALKNSASVFTISKYRKVTEEGYYDILYGQRAYVILIEWGTAYQLLLHTTNNSTPNSSDSISTGKERNLERANILSNSSAER